MASKPKPGTNSEGNKYDKIIKENLQSLIPVLLRKVLKLDIIRMENLPQVKLQTTREREPDFLKKVFDGKHPGGCIFQIEFEGKDEKVTDARMLEYFGIEYRKFKLPIFQFLVYLPEGKPKNITGSIELENLSFRYTVICLSAISYREFIYSEVPEEVILSILANPDGENREAIIRLILERLIKLKGDSLATRKFLKQLEILSQLRNLQGETVKQIDNMSISFDITKDVRFQQGMEIGEEKKAIIAIRDMLKLDFDTKTIAQLLRVKQAFVLRIKKQLEKEALIISLLEKGRADTSNIASELKVSRWLVEIIKKDNEA